MAATLPEPLIKVSQMLEQKSKILIVDDVQANLELLGDILGRKGYEIVAANNGQKALLLAKKVLPDLILLDVMMPDISGYDVCEKLKQDEATKGIPIIFLSAKNESKDVVDGFSYGAVDYVSKPFIKEELMARVKTHLELKHQKEELKEYIKIVEELSATDKLTQISNRLKLDTILEHEYERFKREKEPFSVIIMDLDDFKSVNDTYGHASGDKVLIDFAEILKNSIRASDVCGRWGGEEFLAILPKTNIEQALFVAEKIRADFTQVEFDGIGKCTCSFGVSEALSSDTIDTLLMRADDALYQAKREGKNRVCKG